MPVIFILSKYFPVLPSEFPTSVSTANPLLHWLPYIDSIMVAEEAALFLPALSLQQGRVSRIFCNRVFTITGIDTGTQNRHGTELPT